MTPLDGTPYPALRLTRIGTHAVVSVETPRGFVEVMRENLAGWPEVEFDQIVSPGGIEAAVEGVGRK